MICIPIKKKTVTGVLHTLTKTKEADLVEIWFDELNSLSEQNIKLIFKSAKKPILYKSSGDLKKIEQVLASGPKFIDLDVSTKKATIKKIKTLSPKTQIILSHHDFKRTPTTKELKKIVSQMTNKGADINKIATFANSLADSLRVLELLTEQKIPAIFICMGKYGEITRTTGHLFGNYLTYAPLSEKDKTAPGQVVLKKLIEIRKLI